MQEVVPGVWACGTRFVNWYVVEGSDGLTVVDGGLPGYAKQLDRVLRRLGRQRSDVKALLLTHGHIDHTGLAAPLARSGVPVHLHPADVELAGDTRRNETDSSVVPYLKWPATWAFLGHCVARGALRPPPMPETVPLVDGTTADVPGRPLVAHVPGHTRGSCLLDFRDHGVVLVGDLLCTVDPRTGRRAQPQIQTRGSNWDSDLTMTSLEALEQVASRTVLPGHGTPWHDGVPAAVASAREVGCR